MNRCIKKMNLHGLGLATSMHKCLKACITVYKHITVYAKKPSAQVTASLKQKNFKHYHKNQVKGEYR